MQRKNNSYGGLQAKKSADRAVLHTLGGWNHVLSLGGHCFLKLDPAANSKERWEAALRVRNPRRALEALLALVHSSGGVRHSILAPWASIYEARVLAEAEKKSWSREARAHWESASSRADLA